LGPFEDASADAVAGYRAYQQAVCRLAYVVERLDSH